MTIDTMNNGNDAPWSPDASEGGAHTLTAEAHGQALESLHAKIDRLTETVARIDRRREELEELVQDMIPAVNGAMVLARDRLQQMDENGAFANALELPGVAETALAAMNPDDLRALAQATPELVRAARVLASPRVTSLAPKLVEAMTEAEHGPAPSIWQLVRQARAPRARRGMSAALTLLRTLGEGGSGVAALPPLPAAPVRAAPRRAAAAPQAACAAPTAADLQAGDRTLALDADGNLADPSLWDRDVAEAFAAQAGVALTPEHWKVLDFVRADGADSGTAPGIRKIVAEVGVTQKELYQLFPGGPAVLAARLAGLSKPKSCV